MNKQDKSRIKAAVLRTLQTYGKPLSMPVPIKAIAKSASPNIRLISYSRQMKRRRMTYEQMLSFTGTEDACTDYDAKTEQYIIYYNDVDPGQLSSNRYRWTIAHELGHIALNHHRDHTDSRIYRSRLSNATYKKMEQEADMFAAYILSPHIVLSCLGIGNKNGISEICRISGTAARYRLDDFNIWKRRNRSEWYDFSLLNLYADFIEASNISKRAQTWLNKYRKCGRCSSRLPVHYRFCPICNGFNTRKYALEAKYMKYEGIQTDEKRRATKCPICQNDELSEDGTYCMICGNSIVNWCSSEGSYQNDPCSLPLPGNARFCPNCGKPSTFFIKRYLKSWDGKEYDDQSPGISIDLNKFLSPEEELPF